MSDNANGKIVSGMIWRFGEKITAQGVSFIVSLVLARILTPEDYGIIGIVSIFIAIAEVFVTSGFGTALIQKKDATELDFSTLCWFNVAFSVILYAIIIVGSPLISAFYEMPELTPVLRVFAIRIPINAFNSIQNAYVSRNMDFKKFFFSTIIGTIISAFVGIYMATHGYGVWALIAQILTNTVIDTTVLFITIKWKPKFIFSLDAAKPLIKYGWKILATDLIGTIFNQINAFVIGKKYTTADLAYYTKGKTFPDIINNNVSSTLAAVLFPAMSLSSGIEEIKSIRRKSLKMMEYIIFPLMFGMITVADKMIIVLIKEKWLPAVPYVRISALAAAVGILGTTLIQETKAIGRSDMTLKIELLKKPIMLALLLVAMRYGVKAIAMTLIINEFVAFAFNVYPVRKFIGFDFKLHLMDAFSSLWMALVMSAIVYAIGKIITNNVVALVVQVLTGAAVYIALSVITKHESFLYLIQFIKSKLHRGQA